MNLRITCDANSESGVGIIIDEISGPTRKHFLPKAYGDGLKGIVIVLMCRNPDLNFKQRIRFSKKDKTLYMDVMLDLKQMIRAAHQDRKRTIINRLTDEVPIIIHKYSFPDFDEKHFVEELKNCLNKFQDTKASAI